MFNRAAPYILLLIIGLNISIVWRPLVLAVKEPQIEGHGTVDGPVRAGDTVLVEWTILKRTECAGSSARTWKGEGGFRLSEALRATGLPMTDSPATYKIQTRIPDLAPVGPLSLSIIGSYDCGGIVGPESFRLGPVEIEVVE